jgi:hypothetical protein
VTLGVATGGSCCSDDAQEAATRAVRAQKTILAGIDRIMKT